MLMRNSSKHIVVLYFILFLFSAIEAQIVGYKNPVIRGFYPDPSVCRVNNDYYLVCSSFEFFPGIPLFHSKDLVNWEQIGYVIKRESQLSLNGQGLYAPTIRYHNGKFYVVCTNVSGNGNFMATTNDIRGEWSDPVNINQGGIDPSLFFDDDGKVYLTTNGNPKGIYLSEIDPETGKILSPVSFLTQGTGGRYPEGPHIYKKDNFYYLLLSEGGTEYGHMVTVFRSKNIWGPYMGDGSNPILTHRNDERNPLQGTGHADLVQAHDGSWWAVFLAFRTTGMYTQFHHLGRETCLLPVTWTPDGWPRIYDGRARTSMNVKTLPQFPKPALPEMDEFSVPDLPLHWNFLRKIPVGISLTRKPGWLSFTGTAQTLDSVTSTFMGRRQTEMSVEATTLIDFEPVTQNEEAGLTAFMNNKSYYAIGVFQTDNSRAVKVNVRLGHIKQVVASAKVNPGPLHLRIISDPNFYYFQYSADGSKFQTLSVLDTKYLSSEVAGGFTGVYLGVYATGNGSPSNNAAYFDWFNYKVLPAMEE